jgi:hypothetical protein
LVESGGATDRNADLEVANRYLENLNGGFIRRIAASRRYAV